MRVKLTRLDSEPSLYINMESPVILCDPNYEIIGTCKFVTDRFGKHFGDLDLDQEVDPDLFFYYNFSGGVEGYTWFDGIKLTREELKDTHATRLRDMIV